MKMRNILLGGVFVIIIAISGALFFVLNSLDTLVKSGIEEYGSKATKTKVEVDGVNILLQEGGGTIKGISVANLAGFSDPHVFTLGEINARIDVNSLGGDALIIDEIRIHVPEIYYEINSKGKANLRELRKNLSGGKKQESSTAQETSDDADEARLVIRRFILDGGSLKATIMPLNGKVEQMNIPRLQLTNIGGESGSDSSEVSRQLLNAIIEHALQTVAERGMEKYLADHVEKGLATEAMDSIKKSLGTGESNLGDNLKEMFAD